MVDLYINGYKADITSDVQILLSKSFNDYKNPTIVNNTFSKTVSLPSTEQNERIFNNLFRLDKRITSSSFNPSKRVEFFLQNDYGTMIEKGYIKLDDITINNSECLYNITLYGELGNILYGLTYKTVDSDDKLTLADLDYGIDLGFTISRNTVSDCWIRLQMNNKEDLALGDIINFAVTYDGIPDIDNFDFNKCFCVQSDYSVSSIYSVKDDSQTRLDGMPSAYDENGNIVDPSSYDAYYTLAKGLYGYNTTIKFALLETEDELSALEMKDLRSYMLRPVIKLSEVTKAIGRYIAKNYGYVLVTDDEFFSSDEYLSTWITLSCLYEDNPSIKSFDFVSQSSLLGKTSEPSSYLLSFIKTYGLYIDIDIYAKKVYIVSRKNFYKKIEDLTVDESQEKKVTPLTFNKKSYTFDYSESELDLCKTYKENYDKQYGSKIVNTGFQFDNSTSKYIENNAYKEGIDTLDYSRFFTFNNVPSPLMPYYEKAECTLFHKDEDSGVITTSSVTLQNIPQLVYVSNSNLSGIAPRIGIKDTMASLNPYNYYDFFPRLKCCNSDGSPVSSSNILVRFNGFKSGYVMSANYPDLIKTGNIDDIEDTFGRAYFTGSDMKVGYCVTDDNLLQYNNGNRCWMYSPVSNDAVYYTESLPCFNRNLYDEDFSYAIYQMYKNPTDWTLDNGVLLPGPNGLHYEHNSENLGGPYTNMSLKARHKYVALYSASFSTATELGYVNFSDSRVNVLSHTTIDEFNVYRNGATIFEVNSDQNITVRMYALRTDIANSIYDISVLKLYDLTDMDFNFDIRTPEDAIEYLGVTKGYSFGIEKTYDFAYSEERTSEYILPEINQDLYSRYWKDYIAELYRIDNRILECQVYLDDFYDAFKKIWWYDGCRWTLSTITDYDYDTKKCKVKLVKVSDLSIYMQ